MKIRKSRWSLIAILLIGLFMSSGKGWAAGEALTPSDRPLGQTYGNWAENWWKWAAAVPADVNPLFDETGANAGQGQSGPVFYLGGTFTGGPVTRDITISKDKYLFFPLVSIIMDNTDVSKPLSEDKLIKTVKKYGDMIEGQNVTLDGVNVESYRETTDGFSVSFEEEGSLYSALYGHNVASPVNPVVQDGYWLFLKPLAPGNHTLTFGGGIPAFGFSVDVTYNITVTP